MLNGNETQVDCGPGSGCNSCQEFDVQPNPVVEGSPCTISIRSPIADSLWTMFQVKFSYDASCSYDVPGTTMSATSGSSVALTPTISANDIFVCLSSGSADAPWVSLAGPRVDIVATCTDSVQNGIEAGVDCGGACPSCVPFSVGPFDQSNPMIQNQMHTVVLRSQGGFRPGDQIKLSSNSDCIDGDIPGTTAQIYSPVATAVQMTPNIQASSAFFCFLPVGGPDFIRVGETTVISTCSDGVKNGNEQAVDCGGNCGPLGSACVDFSVSPNPLVVGSPALITFFGIFGDQGRSVYLSQDFDCQSVIDGTFVPFLSGLVAGPFIPGRAAADAILCVEDNQLSYSFQQPINIVDYFSGDYFLSPVRSHFIQNGNNSLHFEGIVGTNVSEIVLSYSSFCLKGYEVHGGAAQLLHGSTTVFIQPLSTGSPVYVCHSSNGILFEALNPPTAVLATCSDSTRNGFETGLDCGGPVCPSCPPTGFSFVSNPSGIFSQNKIETLDLGTSGSIGSEIKLSADQGCISDLGNAPWPSSTEVVIKPTLLSSVAYLCFRISAAAQWTLIPGQTAVTATCFDNVQNGGESGKDCGGPMGCQVCPAKLFNFEPSPMVDDKIATLSVSNNLWSSGGSVRLSKEPSCLIPVLGAENMPWTVENTIVFTPREVTKVYVCTSADSVHYTVLPGFSSIQSSCMDGVRNGVEDGSDCGGPDCVKCPPTMHPTLPTYGSLLEYVPSMKSIALYYVPVPTEASVQKEFFLAFNQKCAHFACVPFCHNYSLFSCALICNKIFATHV